MAKTETMNYAALVAAWTGLVVWTGLAGSVEWTTLTAMVALAGLVAMTKLTPRVVGVAMVAGGR